MTALIFGLAFGLFAAQNPPFMMAKCDATAVTFDGIRLPHAVLADGKTLAADTYQVRITSEHAAPRPGQSSTGECWVEFVKNGAVAGRELASVVPSEEIASIAEGPGPGPSGVRVDLLKGDEYLRVWLTRAGTHYIINLPVAVTR